MTPLVRGERAGGLKGGDPAELAPGVGDMGADGRFTEAEFAGDIWRAVEDCEPAQDVAFTLGQRPKLRC